MLVVIKSAMNQDEGHMINVERLKVHGYMFNMVFKFSRIYITSFDIFISRFELSKELLEG